MIKQFKVDRLSVSIYDTREEMGRAAYLHYRERVGRMMAGQPTVRAIFAAAHSQNDFLEAMREDNGIDFTRMEAFHMDEYMGLGADATQNFGNFLRRAIFSMKPFKAVNYIKSDAGDVDAECGRYEELLRAFPLDVVSMGIGENAHIAFNDPHEARFDDPRWVRRVTLDDVCRQQQVNDGEFAAIDLVPKSAVTLTIPALMSCRSVVCVVPNARKAQAVRDTLYGPVSEACPASVLRHHHDAALFLDREAAGYVL